MAVPGRSLYASDLDGDGRDEVLAIGNRNTAWQGLPRVLFFNEAGAFSDAFDPRIPANSPIALGYSATTPTEHPHQIAFATSAGIGVIRADANHTIVPIAYPVQVLPQGWTYRVLRVRGNPQAFLGDSILLFMGEPTTQPNSRSEVIVANSGLDLAPLQHPIDRLAGEPVATNVDSHASSPCEEVLLVFKGDSHVYMLKPCDSSGTWIKSDGPPAAAIDLGQGRAIAASPIAAKINDDDALDVMISGEDQLPYVSFGHGDGSFSADPNQPATTAGQAWPVVVSSANCPLGLPLDSHAPLAIGDLNSDGKSDWVTPSGIQLTQSVVINAELKRVEITACATNTAFVRKWSIACIADLNHDSLPDVVAGSNVEPDLDFFRGTGFDALNPSGIVTGGPVSHMVIGDFDGDLVSDIAFAASREARATATDNTARTLSIAFGNVALPPNQPVEIGTFAEIDQLQTGKYSGVDAMDEIGVVATPSAEFGQQLSVFLGSSGRRPIAPLGLERPVSEGVVVASTPLALASGVLEKDKTSDLLALAIGCDNNDCTYRLWRIPSRSDGSLGAPVASGVIRADFAALRDDLQTLSATLTVGDVNNDGNAEAFVLSTTSDNSQVALWSATLPKTEADWAAWVYQQPLQFVGNAPGTLVDYSNPTLLDLDGDKYGDLLLLTLDANGHARVNIAWNQQGQLTLTNMTYVALDGEPRGWALANPKGTPSVVILTDSGLYKLSIAQRDRTPTVERIGQMSDTSFIPGGNSVAAGDLNGDGLTDYAIGSLGTIQLFTEVPAQK